MELILATSNVHKIREFREMLRPLKKVEILSLHQFPDYTPPKEMGSTFKENAVLKATHASQALKKWAIADDSGLIVPLLNNEPGVYSRRYAGEEATEAENRKKLLLALSGKHELERAAYFECCIALASPEGLKKCVMGRVEGVICHEEKGRNGFGYDPIFIKHDYDKTFAELEDPVKNRVSHRRKALDKLLLVLENLC